MIQNDKSLLTRLKHHDVEFVIIGGVCGVMHGVSLVTRDLEICCRFTPDNLPRLEAAVKDLHSAHRFTANKLPLELRDELCASLKNLYLKTDFGILDCLSEVLGLGNYEQALKSSVNFKMSYGEFRILSVDDLITAKEAAGRERDLEAVKELRAIIEKKNKAKTEFNRQSQI